MVMWWDAESAMWSDEQGAAVWAVVAEMPLFEVLETETRDE